MGKKDFFKFPSKKTMEYILIGILFVAVLSCTMKMLNNISIEGFNSCSDNYNDSSVCSTSVTEDQETGYSLYLVSNGTLATLTTNIVLALDTTTINITFSDTATDAAAAINTISTATDATDLGNVIVKAITIDEARDLGANVSNEEFAFLAKGVTSLTLSGTEIAASTVVTANDDKCSSLKTILDIDDNREASEEDECIQNCEEFSSGDANCDGSSDGTGGILGCNLNADGDGCECGARESTESDSWYIQDAGTFEDNHCLQSSILNVYGSEGTLPGSVNQGVTGDVCSPRWPCINSQKDYIDIISKRIESCNEGNISEQNEMKLSFCQPYGSEATFSECNSYKTQEECLTHSDVDSEKCTWNPYCLQSRGSGSGIAGINGGQADTRECKNHLNHQNCMNDSECYWNWGLAEEINGFRDETTDVIPEDSAKLSYLKERISRSAGDICRDNSGSTLDNIRCSATSAANTLISGRDVGFCPTSECSNDSVHAYCQYCSTLALDNNTPGVINTFTPSWFLDYIEEARVQTGTNSGSESNISNERCHKIFRH